MIIDDGDEEFLDQRREEARRLLRGDLGGSFRRLDGALADIAEKAFPDGQTTFMPVLIVGVIQNCDSGPVLIGTTVAAPKYLTTDAIQTILGQGVEQVSKDNCTTVRVLDDGESVPEKDIQ